MRAEGRVVAVTYGRDLFPPTVTIELEQGTENPWKLGDEVEVLRANSAEAEWQYQKQDTLARGAVVDFTDTLPACAVCGAAAYFHAYPDGYGGALFAVRWRCGHEPAERMGTTMDEEWGEVRERLLDRLKADPAAFLEWTGIVGMPSVPQQQAELTTRMAPTARPYSVACGTDVHPEMVATFKIRKKAMRRWRREMQNPAWAFCRMSTTVQREQPLTAFPETGQRS